MTSQHSIIDNVNQTDSASLVEQLHKARSDLRIANETIAKRQLELDAMQQESSIAIQGRDQKLVELREQLRQSDRKYSEQEEKFDLYLEVKLAEKEVELNDECAEKMKLETMELRQERDKLRQDAVQDTLKHAIKLHEFNAAWSRNLTAILANTINNQEISPDLLRLPILSQPIPLLHDYSFTIEAYVFAEVYTGLEPDVVQATRDDFRIIEVLCWTNNMSVPSDIPADNLGQIVWLEANLLEKIRIRQTRDSWVLLAFSLLSKMVISNSWPARCIAAFRLAVLKRQYLPYSTAVWDDFVTDLLERYNQLGTDPLSQACLAYLCLTTRDPSAAMTRYLPTALSQGGFDASIRIPELVARLSGSPDVALANSNGTLSIVILRYNQHQDAVFSKIQNSTNWSFSLQPLQAWPTHDARKKVTWGPAPEQSIVVDGASDVWGYINRHHRDTLIAQVNAEYYRGIEAMIARFRWSVS